MGLGTGSVVHAQGFRAISATKETRLGQYAETVDGRGYRYALAGGVTLAPGKITVNADLAANHTDINSASIAAVGSNVVTATLGATAATANQYQDGYLTVNDATGEGVNYLISGNSAAASSGVITVNLTDPIVVALAATTTQVTLKLNPWAGVVISAVDQVDLVTGVPNVSITNAYYGWVQTRGECAVLADEAVAKGSQLELGSSVAGSVEAVDQAAAVATTGVVGIASEALVDTEYRSVYLSID